MVYRAACAFLKVEATWRPSLPAQAPLALAVEGKSDKALLEEALRARYRIEDDDRALRQIVAAPVEARGAEFRRYREAYPPRRELTGTAVTLSGPRPRLAAALSVLGAAVEVAPAPPEAASPPAQTGS
jgi:hypothetical protein